MTLFVDASAIVAMVAREPEARRFAERLGYPDTSHTSPIALWEAVRAVERVRGVEIAEARALVDAFITDGDIQIMPIGTGAGRGALDAYDAYGKGRHPAALNMGDCFAYACARTNNARLLYKGDDFARTDLT